jgi:hypothetical protein
MKERGRCKRDLAKHRKIVAINLRRRNLSFLVKERDLFMSLQKFPPETILLIFEYVSCPSRDELAFVL